MATAGNPDSDEETRRLLECPVCMNLLQDPRMLLPCQHTFCKSCLTKLVNNNSISCPVCRNKVTLTDKGVEGLLKNRSKQDFLDQMCKVCEDRKSKLMCAHCNKKVCHVCHQKHEEEERASNIIKADLRKLDAQRKPDISRLTDKIINVSINLKTKRDDYSAKADQIKKTFDEIVHVANERRKTLLEELSKIMQPQIKTMEDHKTSLEKTLKQLQSLSDQASRLADDEMLLEGKQIIEKWEKTLVTSSSLLSAGPDQSTPPELLVDTQPVMDVIQSFGELKEAKTFPGGAQSLSPSASTPPVHIQYSSLRNPRLVFGGKGKGKGKFMLPTHAAVSPVTGNIIVTDTDNHRIQIFNSEGEFVSQFGSKGEREGQYKFCTGVAVTPQGALVVCDTDNHRLYLLSEQGHIMRTIGHKGTAPGRFYSPGGVATDSQGLIYVSDSDNRQVQVLDQRGIVVRVIGERESRDGWVPHDVAISPHGEVVVCFTKDISGKLEVYRSDGQHKTTLCTGQPGSVRLVCPLGVAVDWEGNIIVSDYRTSQVHILRPDGRLIYTLEGWGHRPGKFDFPVGVTCTRDGRLVVVDAGNNRVHIF